MVAMDMVTMVAMDMMTMVAMVTMVAMEYGHGCYGDYGCHATCKVP